jgi:hypothetical protein
MNYKMLSKHHENDPQIYARVDDDGLIRVTCIEGNPEFQAWLAEGNTPLPPDQPDPWEAIRQKRDQLIRDSDWTMIPGATVDQAQWSAYRQILRDLPQTYSNPEDVVWPTPPSTSGPNTIEE